jgi:outer membrane protein assembly factor BamB
MAYQTGHVYVGAANKSLTALQTSDGSILWSEPLAGPVTGVSATVGMLFTELSDGTVTGVRTSGYIVWMAKTGAGLSGTPTIMVRLRASGSRVDRRSRLGTGQSPYTRP